jgi:tRNA(Ile)-lysidine synthase TilS/MesJ
LLMNIFHRGDMDTMRPSAHRRQNRRVPIVRPFLLTPETLVKAAAPVSTEGLFDCGMCSVHAVERARVSAFVAQMFGTHGPAADYARQAVEGVLQRQPAGRRRRVP